MAKSFNQITGISFFSKTLLIVSAILLTAQIQASPILDSDDKAVRYRQSAYFILRSNTGPLAAMARGKMDYDAEMFKTYAAKVAMIAELPQDGFAQKWLNYESNAKADIWDNKADFDQKMANFIKAAKAMAVTAQTGDKSDNIKAFGKMGKTCKACHDKYKKD
jgi:cytochrome c556